MHNLKPLEQVFTERTLKKRKTEDDSQSKTNDDLVSLRSNPEAEASNNSIDSTTHALMHRDPVSPPNGTAAWWSKINDCYVDEPLFIPSWENEMQSSSEDEEPPLMIPPHGPDITIDQIKHMDQVDEMLNDIKNCEYMEEYAGEWSVHSPKCIHKAKPAPVDYSKRKFGRSNKDVDDAPLKYLDWVARGRIVPQLHMSIMYW